MEIGIEVDLNLKTKIGKKDILKNIDKNLVKEKMKDILKNIDNNLVKEKMKRMI